MSFTPTNFQDLPSTATPIDAVELNNLGTQHAAAVADSAAQVPGLVSSALADDATIRSAATTAVDDAITAEGAVTDPVIASAVSDTTSDTRAALSAIIGTGGNLIINGDFRINQRGTVSGASISGSAYFLDRWRNFTGSSRGDEIRWSDSGGVRTLTLKSTPAAGTYIGQIVEAANTPAGTYTVSCSNAAVAINVSTSAGVIVVGYGAATFSTDGTKDIIISLRVLAGDPTQSIQWVKLERGTVPTQLVSRLYGAELPLCQRYYSQIGPTGVNNANIGPVGYQAVTTGGRVLIKHTQLMRAAPTVSYGGTLSWTDNASFRATLTSIASSWRTPESTQLVPVFAAAGAAYRPGFVDSSNGTGWISFDAEL